MNRTRQLTRGSIVLNGIVTNRVSHSRGRLRCTLLKSPTLSLGLPVVGMIISSVGNVSYRHASAIPLLETKSVTEVTKRIRASISFRKMIATAMESSERLIAYGLGSTATSNTSATFRCCSQRGALCRNTSDMSNNGFTFDFTMPGSVGCSNSAKLVGLCTIDGSGTLQTGKRDARFGINNDIITKGSSVNPSMFYCLGSPAFISNNGIGAAPCFITEVSSGSKVGTTKDKLNRSLGLIVSKSRSGACGLGNCFSCSFKACADNSAYCDVPRLPTNERRLAFAT